MKTLCGIMLLVAVVAGTGRAKAVVACPDAGVVTQPDGSKLTLLLYGDEWFNYNTTADGYTVVKDYRDGYYKYAMLDGNVLRAGNVVARDESMRSQADVAMLAGMERHLTPPQQAISSMRAPARKLHGMTGHYDYKNFRGLVILVQYEDCPFVYDDAHTLFNDMINQRDYKGFMSNAMFPELIPYTGSVRDYFLDSSAGEFDPQFDVVGPVTINYSMYDMNKTSNAQAMVTAALKAADAQVNYKDYDRDGNGTVDMVFFLFAGPGSNFSGNDQRLLWPHASTITSLYLDGVSFGRYACSTELFGRPESKVIDGIGTICHEFSHVLGIADLYDTDGTSSGGSCVNPVNWSLMAHGSYLNQSRTPCAYSVYERYAAGFITPQTISRKGTYNLKPLAQVNNGYRLDTPVEGEYFLLENRTRTGWDAYLPGEGMLVWRVDSTDAKAWDDNKVNCNPAHPLYELMRAGGGTTDSGSDPFPGTAGITSINNSTTPSLSSWTGRKGRYGLENIARNSNGTVSFQLTVMRLDSYVEDFEEMALTTDDASNVKGRHMKWSFTKGARVAAVTAAGNGEQACLMMRSSELTSSALPWDAQSMSYDFYNPTPTTAVVRTQYKLPSSTTWVNIKNGDGIENVSVSGGSTMHFETNAVLPQGTQVRIVEYSGSRTDACYIDDIEMVVAGEDDSVPGDVNGDGTVDIIDVNAIIGVMIDGASLPGADVDGNGIVDVIDINQVLNIILNL